MKYLQLLFSILIVSICVFSCKKSDNPERNKLHDEMMAIHDEVMPEMKTIHYLEKDLKKKIETTVSQDSLIMMKATLKRLTEAGTGMMDWMHKLDVPGRKVPDPEAIAYLKMETEKISNISSKMRKSILSAKGILGEK